MGKLGRSRGSVVRFVVRPVDAPWVMIMAIAALAMGWFIAREMVHAGNESSVWGLLVLVILPLAPTFRAGFDLDVEKRTTRVWQAWGPITYASFTWKQLKMPQVRTGMESRTNSEGIESRSRVTRLYWGTKNIRSTLKPGKLTELLEEARELVPPDSTRSPGAQPDGKATRRTP
jgi:hypothetical protein